MLAPALILQKVYVHVQNHELSIAIVKFNVNGTYSLSLSLSAAYGYGFLMVTAVSLLSLLGLILLPFIKNSKLAYLYEYISTFMIALGTSAVFSGAIFHLFPRVHKLILIHHSD